METQTKVIIALTILILLLVGVIATERIDFCKTEQTRNESHALGFNEGRESWNLEVMVELNNNGVIPYWFNQTRYELPISQLCGGQNE